MSNKEFLVIITNNYEEDIHRNTKESMVKLKTGDVLTVTNRDKDLKMLETYHGSISEESVKMITDEDSADGIVTTVPVLVTGGGNAKLFEAGEFCLVYDRDDTKEVAFEVDAMTTIYVDLNLLEGKYVFVKDSLPSVSLEEQFKEVMEGIIDRPITLIYEELKELGELYFVFQYESRGYRYVVYALQSDDELINFKVRIGWHSIKGYEIIKNIVSDASHVNTETGETYYGYPLGKPEFPYLVGERVVFDKEQAEDYNASDLAYSKVNTGTIVGIDPEDNHGLVLEVRPDDWEPTEANRGILIGHVPLDIVMPDN